MNVTVHGRHLNLPSEVRALAAEKAEHLARYLDGADRAEVLFLEDHAGRDGGQVCCEIIVRAKGRFVRVRARGAAPAAALEVAIDKAGHRLSRMKERLVQRSRPRHGVTRRVLPGPTA